ncbi:hypothetical protein DFH28DRAFT_898792 [Melampsora americana]|nr:hypothetical protein DFH28DRAFT_898792 [Melampsora americana]
MKAINDQAKAVKESAATALAKANDLRDAQTFRRQSAPACIRTDLDEVSDDGSDPTDVGKRAPTTLRALRDGVLDKISNHENSTHMVNVTLKSNSEAAERANELTSLALERHQEQIIVMNKQRERELAQAQARLDMDSQIARDTLTLRREELAAAAALVNNKDDSITELKTSMASVQGSLTDMGSVLKLLAERLPPANGGI